MPSDVPRLPLRIYGSHQGRRGRVNSLMLSEHAQELYRLLGDRPGSAVDDWLRAEEEIRAEQVVDEALEASFPASDPPAH